MSGTWYGKCFSLQYKISNVVHSSKHTHVHRGRLQTCVFPESPDNCTARSDPFMQKLSTQKVCPEKDTFEYFPYEALAWPIYHGTKNPG